MLIEAIYVAGFKFEIRVISAGTGDVVIEKNADLIRHHMKMLARTIAQVALDEDARAKNRQLEF